MTLLKGKEKPTLFSKPKVPKSTKIDDVTVPDWIEEQEKYDFDAFEYRSPSHAPFPVFVLCQPMYVDTAIANNVWMKALTGDEAELDKERFMGEWYNFFKLLAADSLIYLLPPKQGLQDQCYVNSFVYLPHIPEREQVVLSNFTADGREGEEIVAGNFLSKLGYNVVKCPHKFEGYPELKYLKDNVYFGGYGQRTEIGALEWFEKEYGAKVIKIKEDDPHLYHLDCLLFILDEKNIMCCTEAMDRATIKEIEKVCEIHSVSSDACHESVCNSVRVHDLIITSSSLMFMQKREKGYNKEYKKNAEVEKICSDLGLELMYIEMSEAAKSGAALSCFCAPLNVRY